MMALLCMPFSAWPSLHALLCMPFSACPSLRPSMYGLLSHGPHVRCSSVVWCVHVCGVRALCAACVRAVLCVLRDAVLHLDSSRQYIVRGCESHSEGLRQIHDSVVKNFIQQPYAAL